MFPGLPNASEITCASRTTSGTLITIPAGRWYTGNVSISASVTAAATATPVVTVSGAGAAPASGTAVARLSITGLALTTVTDSNDTEIIVKADAGDVTLEFNTGGATSAAVTVNGYILG